MMEISPLAQGVSQQAIRLAQYAYGRASKAVRDQAKKRRRLWQKTERPYRLHFFGHGIAITWWLLFTATKNELWLFPLLLVAGGLYLTGFVIWFAPLVRRLSASKWTTWAFWVSHGFLLIFSAIYARSVVQEALQLPPQYFDLTVGLVALLAYIPVCLAIAMAIMFLLCLLSYVAWAIGKFVPSAMRALAGPFLVGSKKMERFERKLDRRFKKLLFISISTLAAALFLAATVDGLNVLTKHSHIAVRWIAYYADFHMAGRYPGVPQNARIRIQDNGVVAVARIKSYDIAIETTMFKIEEPASNTADGLIQPSCDSLSRQNSD